MALNAVLKMLYGVCCGGPYDGKKIAHDSSPYSVAIVYGVPFAGQMAPTIARPVWFGQYLFDDTGKVWVWDGPET